MNKLLKTIKSVFTKNKHTSYTRYVNKINIVNSTIVNRVSLANINSCKHVFSTIPEKNAILINCKTHNNISNWIILSLTHLCIYSKEELADCIDKELKVLAKQVDCSYNYYKLDKIHSETRR